MDLRPGLYEALVTEAIRRAIESRGTGECRITDVDPVELADVLAFHPYESARCALRTVGGDDDERPSRQVTLGP